MQEIRNVGKQVQVRVKRVNKYLITLIIITLFFSCRESSKQPKFEGREVLLSNLSIPKGFNVIVKDHYFPEGEMSGKNDSIYVLKKRKSIIEITIKYFSNKGFYETIDDRMYPFTEELFFGNNSFKIRNKKINKQKSIWYINYTYGSEEDLLYNFYMERNTPKYRIMIKTYDNQLGLHDIGFLYNELCEFKD